MSDHLAETRARLSAETEARIATLEQLRHTDRLTTVGRLAAGIAHELGTPLNVIAARAGKIAAAEGGRGPTADYARTIQEQAARMTGVIRQLLDFSRRQGPKLGLCNLRTLAGRTIDLLTPFARKQGVTVELRSSEGAPLTRVDQNQIQQVLANVMLNGIQAMPRGGRLVVSIERAEPPPPGEPGAQYLRMSIEDQGEGIATQDLPHIFEPFFTTKDVGEGTGLGLSVAHGIVSDHGGWIDVQSEMGKGTRVVIVLAAAEPGTAEAAS
jgi:signal transduction histidine kinase